MQNNNSERMFTLSDEPFADEASEKLQDQLWSIIDCLRGAHDSGYEFVGLSALSSYIRGEERDRGEGSLHYLLMLLWMNGEVESFYYGAEERARGESSYRLVRLRKTRLDDDGLQQRVAPPPSISGDKILWGF